MGSLSHLRRAAAIVGRGFFNDFEAEGIGIPAARYAVQVCSKYRPRLVETAHELRRRLGDQAQVTAIAGAGRVLQYTSAETYAFAYKDALPRLSGRVAPNAIIIPIRKTAEWWEKPALERHAYFYPHADGATGGRAKGHAKAAEAGISTIYRKVYHNPDGYSRDSEFDFTRMARPQGPEMVVPAIS